MLIDRDHRRWAYATLLATVAGAATYAVYVRSALDGPRGGSGPGLAFGVAGSALMIYAGLLSARKKAPTWRIGRAQAWMKGHLWLGLLSLPLILFHAGLSFGHGALTRVLMWLFLIVILSGLLGVVLQQFLPRVMLQLVPMETIYEQIPHVIAQLRVEADQLIAAACGPFHGQLEPAVQLGRERRMQPSRKRQPFVSAGLLEGAEPLKEFYLVQVRPYLFDAGRGSALGDPIKRAPLFEQVRPLIPPALHEALGDLETICEERRQLSLQARLHLLLHGWLAVHLPLSFALLLLGGVHAVMALRYRY
ncbi:MAG: hypothetical protein HY650_15505 [Acidobacteria bacterium]|nr:hypothetical protein [Acidobacteriota bacterium]